MSDKEDVESGPAEAAPPIKRRRIVPAAWEAKEVAAADAAPKDKAEAPKVAAEAARPVEGAPASKAKSLSVPPPSESQSEAAAVDDGWDDIEASIPPPAKVGAQVDALARRVERLPSGARRHDMRAPRARRSTKDSSHYREVAGEEKPSEERRPRVNTGARPEHRRGTAAKTYGGASSHRAQEPRPRPKTPTREDSRPAPRSAPPEAKLQARPNADRPVEKPMAVSSAPAPVPVEPAPPTRSVAQELSFLAAKPVTQRQKKKKAPLTAKEALQLKHARKSRKKKKGGPVAYAPPPPELDEERDEDETSDEAAESTPVPTPSKKKKKKGKSKSRKAESRDSDAPPSSDRPAKPKGLWAKIKSFFTGG